MMDKPAKGVRHALGATLVLTILAMIAGCDNANVNYGVGYHTGSYGWGNNFSVGISNHHYRRYPRRRGP